jgi:hypothetical protein
MPRLESNRETLFKTRRIPDLCLAEFTQPENLQSLKQTAQNSEHCLPCSDGRRMTV